MCFNAQRFLWERKQLSAQKIAKSLRMASILSGFTHPIISTPLDPIQSIIFIFPKAAMNIQKTTVEISRDGGDMILLVRFRPKASLTPRIGGFGLSVEWVQ